MTPGPWRVVCGAALAVETVEESPRRICSLSYRSHAVSARIPNPETLANADLIAALPELLAAVQVILDTAEIDADDARIAMDALAQIRVEARAVLVKAKVRAYECATCYDGTVVSDTCDWCHERHCIDCDPCDEDSKMRGARVTP